jgi:hypothetical protein
MPFRRTAVLVLVLSTLPSFAAQLGDPDDLLSIETHGFVSQGFIYTTHQNNYLARSNRGSFEFTEIGLNFTKPLLDNLRFGLQLFSRDLGPIGNYTLKADWFYLDYHWKDWLGLRAGRVKLPFGLYNDVSDVDSARVPVLLPPSIYQAAQRDVLLALTGVELYGRAELGRAGALDYHAYVGTIFLDATGGNPGSAAELVEARVPYVAGARLLWESPIEGLTFGATFQTVRLGSTNVIRTTPPITFTLDIPINIWLASVEYSKNNLQIAIEYGRWYATTYATPAFIPPFDVVNERGYAMVSYRLTKWFQPGAYYSMFYPNATVRHTRADEQHDIALSLRFDINPYWLLKLEGHYMIGTAALDPTLNDQRPLTSLAPQWAAFFAKTTVHF